MLFEGLYCHVIHGYNQVIIEDKAQEFQQMQLCICFIWLMFKQLHFSAL